MKIDILVVVVIYKTLPVNSIAVSSLLGCVGYFEGRIRVVVYDNSPVGEWGVADENFEYFAAKDNNGLACAYNYGLQRAVDSGAFLLVTLDQDSVVSKEYIEALGRIEVEQDSCIAVYCPKIIASGRHISPYYFDWKGFPHFDDKGVVSEAINSFSAYSVSHLRSLGGFEEFYWLDALDFSSFSRIERAGWRVGEVPVTVSHDLSVVSGNVPLWRLKNIAYYESCFLFEYVGFFRIVFGLVRILIRSARLLLNSGCFKSIFSIFGYMLHGAALGVRRRLLHR